MMVSPRNRLRAASRAATIALLASALAACAGPAARPAALADELGAIEGRFVANALTDGPAYDGRAQIERILAARAPDETRRALVACIDDMRPSRSVLVDAATQAPTPTQTPMQAPTQTPMQAPMQAPTLAPTGVICHLALTQTIYHEPTGADGDPARDWAGFVAPNADAPALRAARAAWEDVLRTRSWHAL